MIDLQKDLELRTTTTDLVILGKILLLLSAGLTCLFVSTRLDEIVFKSILSPFITSISLDINSSLPAFSLFHFHFFLAKLRFIVASRESENLDTSRRRLLLVLLPPRIYMA